MKFEHFALNVPDAPAMARWYVEHLGLSIARSLEKEPYTHFLADQTGRVFIELYSNPLSAYPDYAASHPLSFHFAFVASDANATQRRLELAGATLYKQEVLPDGTVLVMLRDPWGVPLQLCQRTNPF